MKRIYTLLVLLNFIFIQNNAQTFGWAKYEGRYAYDYGMGIVTDNAGNVYVTGKYEETGANFSGSTVTCVGNHDLYLAKYSPTGSLIYVKTAGGTLGDYAYSIATDGTNNVYVAGEIEGYGNLITFSGSTITLNAIGDNDILVTKWDLNGNLQWARREGGTKNEKAQGVSYDGAGNVYITGHYADTATFGGTTTIYGSGNRDMYVAKYDANGNFQWVRRAGGPGRDEGKAVRCDAAGNVYVAGFFSNNFTLGTNTYTTYSPNFFDGFLAKYDTNGNLLWVKTIAGNYDEVAWSVTMDNAGAIYVGGEFNDVGYFGTTQIYTNGNADAFVAKYDASGNVIWAKGAGGPLVDRIRGIGTDGSNIFVTGQFGGTANFGSSVTAADSSDVFFASVSPAGTFMNALSVGGTPDSPEPLGYESGIAITGDGSGNVYATGSLIDGGTFGTISLSEYDRTDIFVTKITQFVGINSLVSNNRAFHVYPSPGNGDLTIELEQYANRDAELVVYNSLGQVISRKHVKSARMHVDLSSEEDGMYFIEIKSENKTVATKKVIVHK